MAPLRAIVYLICVLLEMPFAYAADITDRIIAETDLDEKIRDICSKYCQGNRSEGKLTRVEVWRIDANTIGVRAEASLRNRHHIDPPKMFGRRIGGGVQAYSYIISVTAYGTLDLRTCMLRIDRIDVSNDTLGLGGLADSQEGKSHRIRNCVNLARGL